MPRVDRCIVIHNRCTTSSINDTGRTRRSGVLPTNRNADPPVQDRSAHGLPSEYENCAGLSAVYSRRTDITSDGRREAGAFPGTSTKRTYYFEAYLIVQP